MDNQELLKATNFVLNLLLKDTIGNEPGAVLSTVLNETEQKTAEKNLVKALKLTKRDKAVGVIGHGTTYIDNICKMYQEIGAISSKDMINLLKVSNRILQCGRGKGKAIIIVQDELIQMDELDKLIELNTITFSEEIKAQKDNKVPDLDVVGMLRKIEDEHRYLHESNKKFEEEIATLNGIIKEKENKIKVIEKELQMKTIATWQ